MKTVITNVYISDDGTHFVDYQKCFEYENMHGLLGHILNNCELDRYDECAIPQAISNYIHQNIDVINSYVNKTHKVK